MPTSLRQCLGPICVLLLSGCVANAQNDGPILPPAEAAAHVVSLIEVAADANAEDPQTAWNDAHTAFEATLESRLITQHGAQRIASVEYGFSRLHGGLGSAKASAVASELGAEIAALSATLPMPTTP